jgi:hypothetical protein
MIDVIYIATVSWHGQITSHDDSVDGDVCLVYDAISDATPTILANTDRLR